jgi:hypothetical protein
MRKILTSLAAAAVLVAGAFVAASVVGSSALAQETGDEAPTVTRHAGLLADALGELVDEDVISQAQADAVQGRVELKAEERREEFGEMRPGHGRRGPGGFEKGPMLFGSDAFEDGVLDADELAELPDDHPFLDPEGPFAGFLEDGQLTLDELREALESGEFGLRSRGFRGFGEGHRSFGSDTPSDAAATGA